MSSQGLLPDNNSVEHQPFRLTFHSESHPAAQLDLDVPCEETVQKLWKMNTEL